MLQQSVQGSAVPISCGMAVLPTETLVGAKSSNVGQNIVDMSALLLAQKHQTGVMSSMVAEFATMKHDLKKLNELACDANESVYEDISDDDSGSAELARSGVTVSDCERSKTLTAEASVSADISTNVIVSGQDRSVALPSMTSGESAAVPSVPVLGHNGAGSSQVVDPGEVSSAATGSFLEHYTEYLDLNHEVKGHGVSGDLSVLTGKLFSVQLNDKKRMELFDKHAVPVNTSMFEAPKVNQEIWRVIGAEVRSKDVKSQKLQNTVLRAGVPIVRAIDKLLSMGGVDNETTVALLVDSLAMLSTANQELNFKRRDGIKRELNSEYQAICSQQNPVTGFLFGDNIGDQLKSIAETNKVGMRVRPVKRGSDIRFNPFARKFHKKPFLFDRPPPQTHGQNRGRGRGQQASRGGRGYRPPYNHRRTSY
ncbi:MAG: hypothetical protein ABW168_04880 [Sedimenticola sp.]